MIIYMAHVGAWFLFWFAKYYAVSTMQVKKKRPTKSFDLLANTLISMIFGLATWSIHQGFFLQECVCK